jgi:nicotinamide phosphoribosyltransferase
VLKCLQILDSKFGHTVNSKGYKVLNHVRVIQGDGVNADSIAEILNAAKGDGYSATNIAFGMGGALLQQHNRDTQKFAMKCSSVTTSGVDIDVFKDPIDDHGKRSKAGRLDVIKINGEFVTVQGIPSNVISLPNTAMETVYENGSMLKEHTFAEVRSRADESK